MLSMLFFIILLCIIITVNWQLRPLGKIAEATDAIAQGNFNTKLPIIKGHSDISHLRDSFVSMQSELTKYIEDLRATTEKKANMDALFAIDAREKIGRAKMADPNNFESVYDAIDAQMKQEIDAVIAGGEDA